MSAQTNNVSKYQYKYLIFFSVFYFMGWCASYPVVYKLITIHNFLESASTLLFPITYAIADVITEVYGYRVARQVIWSGLICGFIFSSALQIISYIQPANSLSDNHSYSIVFGHIIRVYFGITVASIIGSFINVIFISKFKILIRGRLFWARSIFSSAVGELIFTIIGGILVWGGLQPWGKIASIMLNAYVFKLLYALIAVIPISILAHILKSVEGIDIYDIGINYNPFKFNID